MHWSLRFHQVLYLLRVTLTLVYHHLKRLPLKNRKAALAPYVGIWEAKSIEDEKNGTVTEDMYKDVRDVYLAIYGYDFSDDGTGLFVRFGAQKPFTWSVDADG